MKKVTPAQRFFANNWPMRIVVTTGPVLAVVFSVRACEPTVAVLRQWQGLATLALTVLLATGFGFFASLILCIFLGPLYYSREMLNGGPFNVGDRVQILSGPFKDRITTVYSPWQGNSVRVDVGDEAKETFKDVLTPTQLMKVEDLPNKTQEGIAEELGKPSE